MKSWYALFPNQRLRKHFTLPLSDRLLVYAYIRKNACSAFKTLFRGASPFVDQCPDCDALGIMGGYHKSRLKDLRHDKLLSLVVLRDPHARLISLYLNKFVVRSGNRDIFKSYANLTGLDPEKASFRQFLTEYVDRFPFKRLDCHLLPQIAHMGRFPYNGPVRFESLYSDLTRVLGEGYAEKYFRKKVNATTYSDTAPAASVNCMTDAATLAEIYTTEGAVPSSPHFMCDALEHTVRTKYAHDLSIVDKLNADYRRCGDEQVPVLDAHIPLTRPFHLFS